MYVGLIACIIGVVLAGTLWSLLFFSATLSSIRMVQLAWSPPGVDAAYRPDERVLTVQRQAHVVAYWILSGVFVAFAVAMYVLPFETPDTPLILVPLTLLCLSLPFAVQAWTADSPDNPQI